MRMGGDVTDSGMMSFHAATAGGASAHAKYQAPWPTCRHGANWRAGCKDQPVPPTCCIHPPCAWVPPDRASFRLPLLAGAACLHLRSAPPSPLLEGMPVHPEEP